MLILEGCLSTHQSDILVSEKSFDSPTQLFNNRVLSRDNRTEIKPEVKSGYTEGFHFTQSVQYLCILTERLRRYTSLIKACTSHMSRFNQDNFDSPFSSQQGGLITARPCSYDYYLHINSYPYNVESADGQL